MTELPKVYDPLNLIDEIQEGADQYLTFIIGNEHYAVEILRVQEIKGWEPVTHIPNTPHYLCGVLNLRGTIVPIVDLRLRFGMAAQKYTPTTVVIVLKVHDVAVRSVGIVVDAVSDACNVMPEDIKSSPDMGANVNTEYVSGLTTIEEKMIMILDIDRLLSVEAVG